MIRTTICAVFAAALGAGCGASQKDVHAAQTSAYDADFAIVFSETLAAVQELYPTLDENPSAGWIKTAWHQIKISQNQSDTNASGSAVPIQNQAGGVEGSPGGAFSGVRQTSTWYFVRFRVYVLGGRPWRVRIEGEAAEWEPGMKQTPLTGAEVPQWLKGRTEALQVAIYKRLRQHAVEYDPSRGRPRRATKKKAPKLDRYGAIPPDAAKRVHALRAALLTGSYDIARGFLIDEFVWSAGGTPSADQAVIMWKADPTITAKLVSSLEAGCTVRDDGIIACPAEPEAGALVATFADVDGQWMLTSFVSAE